MRLAPRVAAAAVAAAFLLVTPAHAASASSSSSVCTGGSASLAPAQCAAWQDFHQSAFGAATGCASLAARADPCQQCSQGVGCNGTDITSITLGELNLQGPIPASLGDLPGQSTCAPQPPAYSTTLLPCACVMCGLAAAWPAGTGLVSPLPRQQALHAANAACRLGEPCWQRTVARPHPRLTVVSCLAGRTAAPKELC